MKNYDATEQAYQNGYEKVIQTHENVFSAVNQLKVIVSVPSVKKQRCMNVQVFRT
jgi:hypothetical protein